MIITDFLYAINPNDILLGLLFVIFFAIINFALYRTLKNKQTSGIISFCVSLLAVYGINRTNLNVAGLFSNIGLSENLIYTVIPIIIIVGLVFMIWKLKLPWTFILIGALLIIASLIPGLVYEKFIVMLIGGALFLLGLFLLWRKHKKKAQNPQQNTGNGRDALIKAAKQFHNWAKVQSNPKFVGSWANFINWLGKGGWGRSEAEICQRLNISSREFVHIFNRYGKV